MYTCSTDVVVYIDPMYTCSAVDAVYIVAMYPLVFIFIQIAIYFL